MFWLWFRQWRQITSNWHFCSPWVNSYAEENSFTKRFPLFTIKICPNKSIKYKPIIRKIRDGILDRQVDRERSRQANPLLGVVLSGDDEGVAVGGELFTTVGFSRRWRRAHMESRLVRARSWRSLVAAARPRATRTHCEVYCHSFSTSVRQSSVSYAILYSCATMKGSAGQRRVDGRTRAVWNSPRVAEHGTRANTGASARASVARARARYRELHPEDTRVNLKKRGTQAKDTTCLRHDPCSLSRAYVGKRGIAKSSPERKDSRLLRSDQLVTR